MGQDQNKTTSRWLSRLCVTAVIAVAFYILYPSFICGCCFHAIAIPMNLLPVCWGFFALLTYKDRKEQFVGWLAFGLALFSMWVGFKTTIMYAFY